MGRTSFFGGVIPIDSGPIRVARRKIEVRWIRRTHESEHPERITVGRASDCDVSFLHPSVSKLHLVPDSFVASKQPTPLGPPTPKRVAGTEIRLKLSAKALVHFSIRRVPRHPKQAS